MRARQLVPTVGVGVAHAALEQGGLHLTQTLQSWTVPNGLPRRAIVNSFGATGTNVQLILRESEASRLGSTTPLTTLSPALPFKRRRYWFELDAVARSGSGERPVLERPKSIPLLIEGFVREITGYGQGELSFAEPLSHYGVDSLLVMRLLAKLNQHFSIELQLADLALLESIDGLATIIQSIAEGRSASEPSVVSSVQTTQAKNETGKWLLERLS